MADDRQVPGTTLGGMTTVCGPYVAAEPVVQIAAGAKCASCDHVASYHWARIVAPWEGECVVGDCACRGFTPESGG